ncbi:carbon storage regulator [Paenibacillus sp. A3]|nr:MULTISPECIES: carbon storage regulator CsrA [Paenibacillus]KPV59743.1 carbon storage regulator [Paenibacillus sp. A3]MCP1310456.1 carbon storage regulator CsrA [Paenibacillus tyrfis]
MLVLSRKKGQSIMINGNIEIYVVSIEGEQIKLGIKAPSDIKVYRKELLEAIEASNKEAISVKFDINEIKKIVKNLEK